MANAVAVFFAMATQWDWIAGFGGAVRVGLKYSVIEPTAAGLDVKLTPEIFNDLRLLERSALSAWSRRRG